MTATSNNVSDASSNASATNDTKAAATNAATNAATATATAATKPKPKPKRSFYKRQLPNSCIGFASPKGKQIFTSALQNAGCKSFFSLIQQFTTQSEPAYCGLTTLTLVLNALSVDPQQTWKGAWRWYSEEMLNCCVSLEDVQQSGITLQDFHCLAICQGLAVTLTYAVDQGESKQDKKDDGAHEGSPSCSCSVSASCSGCSGKDDNNGLIKFRNAVRQACMENPTNKLTDNQNDNNNNNNNNNTSDRGFDTALVATYSRKVLGQTGGGHFSPIAAYDPISDQVLILDTARFKYGAHWTKLELLYEAMKPLDKDTGRSRGYAILSFKQPSSSSLTTTMTATTNNNTTTPTTTSAIQSSQGHVETTTSTSSSSVVQPISLLFTSRLTQSPFRLKYKRYLQSIQPKEVTFDQVVKYWTTTTMTTTTSEEKTDSNESTKQKNDSSLVVSSSSSTTSSSSSLPSNRIWEILEPLKHHKEEPQKIMVQKLHQTIQGLLQNYNYQLSSSSSTSTTSYSCMSTTTCTSIICHKAQQNHKTHTQPHHALLVVFLASINETCRRRIVHSSHVTGDQLTKEQLLNEASLIASAIETSDQNDLCCSI